MNAIIRNLPALAPYYNEPSVSLPTTLREALETAADFAAASSAASTRAAYGSDFRIFSAWCADHGLTALPATPATVAAFVGDQAMAGMKVSTLGRRISAIKYFHRKAGETSPTDAEGVKAVIRGARRTLGVAPRRMAPLLAESARDIARSVPAGLRGLRDRALILVGFAGAFRRSELCALNCEDVEFTDEGMRVIIRRSKTDGEGKGHQIAIVRGTGVSCPVKALRAYLDGAGITEGSIFRRILRGGHITGSRLTSQTVCRLVKEYADLVGLTGKDHGAHSLRSGFLSSAAGRGASIWKMKEVSRHKSTDVLSDYIRSVSLFENHAGNGLL